MPSVAKELHRCALLNSLVNEEMVVLIKLEHVRTSQLPRHSHQRRRVRVGVQNCFGLHTLSKPLGSGCLG